MINLASLINELILKDLTKGRESSTKYFVVHQNKLFIVDDDSKIELIRRHLKGHPAIDGYSGKNSPLKQWRPSKEKPEKPQWFVHDFLHKIGEVSPDIAVGEYRPKDSQMVVWNYTEIEPRTSLMIKKAAKELNVHIVSRFHISVPNANDTEEVQYHRSELIGGIPETVYHGTSTTVLQNILIYGLSPGKGTSRWSKQDIYHDEHIFFTATFEDAIGYASNAVRVENKSWDNYPIVLELRIPDAARISPDFDADVSATEDPYYNWRVHEPSTKTKMKGIGVSRETGKWGYKGRLPAAFIKWIYYYNTFEKRWHKSRPDVWRKLLGKYDWETIAYRLNMVSQ